MLYIANQTGMRIADLHTVSVLTPERDREDDGVYKILDITRRKRTQKRN